MSVFLSRLFRHRYLSKLYLDGVSLVIYAQCFFRRRELRQRTSWLHYCTQPRVVKWHHWVQWDASPPVCAIPTSMCSEVTTPGESRSFCAISVAPLSAFSFCCIMRFIGIVTDCRRCIIWHFAPASFHVIYHGIRSPILLIISLNVKSTNSYFHFKIHIPFQLSISFHNIVPIMCHI